MWRNRHVGVAETRRQSHTLELDVCMYVCIDRYTRMHGDKVHTSLASRSDLRFSCASRCIPEWHMHAGMHACISTERSARCNTHSPCGTDYCGIDIYAMSGALGSSKTWVLIKSLKEAPGY